MVVISWAVQVSEPLGAAEAAARIAANAPSASRCEVLLARKVTNAAMM